MPSPRSLPSALERFDEVRAHLAEGFAVFSDFDGTLAPIVDRPEDAELPPATREVLGDLAEEVPVAVVSGRQVEDVQARVGLAGVTYVGDHGFTVRGPVQIEELPRPEGLEDQLAKARRSIEQQLADVEGAHVEAKRFSLAVHHRQAAPEASDRVQAAVAAAVSETSRLSIRHGRQVVEVEPAVDWDKGHAVQALLATLAPDEGLSPVYIGDDATDETAFAALPDRGVGVLVAEEPRETRASYRLEGPDEVAAFLRELTRRARGSAGER